MRCVGHGPIHPLSVHTGQPFQVVPLGKHSIPLLSRHPPYVKMCTRGRKAVWLALRRRGGTQMVLPRKDGPGGEIRHWGRRAKHSRLMKRLPDPSGVHLLPQHLFCRGAAPHVPRVRQGAVSKVRPPGREGRAKPRRTAWPPGQYVALLRGDAGPRRVERRHPRRGLHPHLQGRAPRSRVCIVSTFGTADGELRSDN